MYIMCSIYSLSTHNFLLAIFLPCIHFPMTLKRIVANRNRVNQFIELMPFNDGDFIVTSLAIWRYIVGSL